MIEHDLVFFHRSEKMKARNSDGADVTRNVQHFRVLWQVVWIRVRVVEDAVRVGCGQRCALLCESAQNALFCAVFAHFAQIRTAQNRLRSRKKRAKQRKIFVQILRILCKTEQNLAQYELNLTFSSSASCLVSR
jgi:hypothetical protein